MNVLLYILHMLADTIISSVSKKLCSPGNGSKLASLLN